MKVESEEVSFDDLLKDLQKQIPVWPAGYPKNIPKKEFYDDLAFCQDLCKYMPKKSSVNDENLYSDEAVSEGVSEKRLALKRLQRKMKIAELKEKIKTLKGKSLNKKNSLKRKGLKNRLKKKIKVEKRVKEKLNKKKHKKPPLHTNEEDETKTKSPVKKEKKSKTDEPNGLVFSKFDFPEGDENSKKKGHIDPMRMLQKVEKSHKKLREMESRGRIDKVKEIKQKQTWESTIKKAAGEKVKDDIDLLKKSVRKIKNAKNRSKKKWEEREKNKVQKMEEAQKKRKTNIMNKKKEKKKKKVKKLIKKGRIVS